MNCVFYIFNHFFQSLFDGDEDNRMIFKWVNTIAFSDNRNDDHPAVTKNRPDDCVENDSRTIGFMEVKTIDNAANHHKINVDMYSLGDFGKNALSQYGLNKTFQVMAIGKCYIVDQYMFNLTIGY